MENIRKNNDGEHHSSHHSHHSHYSSGNKRHHSSSGNLSEEYRKKKNIRLCWRSLFIAACLGVMIWLVVMIINVDDTNEWSFPKIVHQQENTEQILSELDDLKSENMTLKYELEKYKKKYGDLEQDTENNEKNK